MSEYVTQTGIAFPGPGGERQVEAGKTLTADELAKADVKWLLSVGAISLKVNLNRLKKDELVSMAQEAGIATDDLTKPKLIDALQAVL